MIELLNDLTLEFPKNDEYKKALIDAKSFLFQKSLVERKKIVFHLN